MKLSITEFNLEEEWKKIRKDEHELALEELRDEFRSIGLEEGKSTILKVINLMIADGKTDDISKLTTDDYFLKEMLATYHLD